MGSRQESITIIEVGMILMLSIGLNNHVMIIPLLLRSAGRDAWLSALLSVVPACLLMLLLVYITHVSQQQHIGQWLKERLPKPLVNGLLVVLCIPLFITAAVTLFDTIHWAKVSFLERTPYIAMLVPLAAVCFYLAYAGISSIAIVSTLLLPLVVILGFLVMTANFPHKDAALLFPVLEFGWLPLGRGMLYSLSGLSELLVIVFLQQYIKTPIRYWQLVLMVLVFAELIAGPTYGAISEFGLGEAASLRYPPYEEWRLVTFGFHWSNVDLLAVYQWMSGALIRISLPLFLIAEVFAIQTTRHRGWFIAGITLAVSIVALMPITDEGFIAFVRDIVLPGEFFYWFAAAVAIALLVGIFQHKGVQTHDSSRA